MRLNGVFDSSLCGGTAVQTRVVGQRASAGGCYPTLGTSLDTWGNGSVAVVTARSSRADAKTFSDRLDVDSWSQQ
jgi:hypothetical protein